MISANRGFLSALLLLTTVWHGSTVVGKKIIQIGAIFEDRNTDAEVAFRNAIVRENMYNTRMELLALVRYVPASDSFLAERTACSLASEGVVAIFGPGSAATSNIVASICSELGLPHIIAHPPAPGDPLRPLTTDPLNHHHHHHQHQLTRNFYPGFASLSLALAQIIDDYEWPTFTLLYEHPDSLRRLQDVLQLHGPGPAPVTVRQLSADGDDQPLLKSLRNAGTTHLVLDCSVGRVIDLLRQAQRVQFLEEYQSFVVIALDAHLLDFAQLWPFGSGSGLVRANVTTLRLMDPDSLEMVTAVHDWNRDEAGRRAGLAASAGASRVYDAQHVPTEAALWHDAIRVFAATVREFEAAHAEVLVPARGLRCGEAAGGGGRWEQGGQLMRFMDLKTEHGLTGRIVFASRDEEGAEEEEGGEEDGTIVAGTPGTLEGRTDFYVEILELTVENAFRRIGTWTPSTGVTYTRTQTEVYEQITHSLQNKTIVVAARLGEPYLSARKPEGNETLEGNARYEGYSIDLIDEIAKALNFQYRFELVPDNAYGSLNKKTGKWDGLVKHLLDRKADLAICDLTITFERRTAVDFTSPFMTLGVSILYTKPKKEEPALYQFLKPLSVDVWICMATAFLCIAILQFGLARFAAGDWENPNPGDPNPTELESIWNLQNCIWLATGSIMQQGCDLMPKAASTRIVCGLWWFFTLIVIQSYIANLAAVLTKDRSEATIESAEDLARQTRIKYGGVIGGSTLGFFQESNFSTYQRMWSTMEANAASVLVYSNKEGEERVMKGRGSYAFLMESSSAEYICNRNCLLTQVGSNLDSKGYGIALQMNSPYRTHVSQALLKLQEDGKLNELKSRWWKSTSGDCPPDVVSSDELDMRKLGGVFVLLVGGLLAGIGIGCLEFVWHIRQVAIRQKISTWRAFRRELKFVLDLRQTRRPNFMLEESPSRSNDDNNSARSYELDEWMIDE